MKKLPELVLNILKKNNKIPISLIDVLESDRPIVFYGCGNQGSICEDILSCNMGFDITSFVISDGKNKQTNWNSRLPIYSISELPFANNECSIIITLGNGKEVYDDLKNKGYQHICIINNWEEVNEALRESSLLSLLQRNGIELSMAEELFVYKNFKFINPLKENKMINTMFFREFESITAKIVFGEAKDYQVDSSYEFGQVVLEKGDVVFDCGSNIGIFSATAAYVGCDVFAFEPVEFISQCTKRVAELYADKIKVIGKALSNQIGEIQFIEVNSNNNFASDSSRVLMGESYDENETYHLTKVVSTTIDEFVRENKLKQVDFIKADIEGAERLMLSGAKKTLAEMAPKLSICTYHLPDDKEVLTNIILEANPNYQIEYKWDKLYAHVPKNS